MLPKAEFNRIRKVVENYDESREQLIKQSRDVLRLSKQLIYHLHRNGLQSVSVLLRKTQSAKQQLDRIARKHERLSYEGAHSEGMQEYAEALCYYYFLKHNRIPKQKEVGVGYEDYLLGMCDFSGELTRRAVVAAGKKDLSGFRAIHRLVDDIYGAFLQFNLRNGLLRKKVDSLKWNLKKLEEMAYDLKNVTA